MEIKQPIVFSCSVRQGEYILVNGFPRLVTKSLGLYVITVKNISHLMSGAQPQPLSTVFLRQILIKQGLQNRNFALIHSGFLLISIIAYVISEGSHFLDGKAIAQWVRRQIFKNGPQKMRQP